MADTQKMFVFGPVPSRRLGRSLGIDLVPFKTCSYDCIYCQLGRTTNQTMKRSQYVPVSEVLDQIWKKLDDGPQPDYITLSGSGEPTLHSGVDEIIGSIKRKTNIPVAAITNSSLLWDNEVREALVEADLVIPSLDAGNPAMFKYINRPHPDINFERMVAGLVEFCRMYRGKIWLEVFLLGGVNSIPSQVSEIIESIDTIRPDKIQLNTVVRPPAEDFAHMVSQKEMSAIKAMFGEIAEVIAPYGDTPAMQEVKATTEAVLTMLQRRPCAIEDIASGLGIHRNEAVKHIVRLKEQRLLEEVRTGNVLYYRIAEDANKKASSSRQS